MFIRALFLSAFLVSDQQNRLKLLIKRFCTEKFCYFVFCLLMACYQLVPGHLHPSWIRPCTVYPKKYAHGFVVLCFVVVMQSFIMNSHEVFIHIHQGCFAGTGAIVRLPQCQWSKPDGYGIISQCITTTKHSKVKTVCIFLGIYCMYGTCRVDIVFLHIEVGTKCLPFCRCHFQMHFIEWKCINFA